MSHVQTLVEPDRRTGHVSRRSGASTLQLRRWFANVVREPQRRLASGCTRDYQSALRPNY